MQREKDLKKGEELLKREKELFQKEKNSVNKEKIIIESEIKPYWKEVINKIEKGVQTYEEKKEQNDGIKNQDKRKEISEISTKNENIFDDNKDKENISKEKTLDNKNVPIISQNNEEKKKE